MISTTEISSIWTAKLDLVRWYKIVIYFQDLWKYPKLINSSFLFLSTLSTITLLLTCTWITEQACFLTPTNSKTNATKHPIKPLVKLAGYLGKENFPFSSNGAYPLQTSFQKWGFYPQNITHVFIFTFTTLSFQKEFGNVKVVEEKMTVLIDSTISN